MQGRVDNLESASLKDSKPYGWVPSCLVPGSGMTKAEEHIFLGGLLGLVNYCLFVCLFLAVQGFVFRASCLLGKSPALFVSVTFQIRSCSFTWGWPLIKILPISHLSLLPCCDCRSEPQ
jgi:hypothetical protein